MSRTLLVTGCLLGAVLASLFGQYLLWHWYVEDAAISFAFARNAAEGWGLVRFPGEERVEGFSNPLWVALMAGFELIGFDGFQSSKAMALGLAAVSIPAVWATARRAGGPWGWPILAAWVLALDAQFVIWSASGLENGLFCALLALGLWRTVAEGEDGGFPWAALCFLGLAVTRPEGIAYAAVAGGWALVLEASGERRWRRIAAWLVVFWLPFLAYHGVRFGYFAFEFPATYYAKLGETRFQTWNWNARGWMYLRRYCHELGRMWFLPVFLLGVIGTRGWRGWAVAILTVCTAGMLLYPGVEPLVGLGFWPARLPAPRSFFTARIAGIGLLALGVPLMGIGNRGWRVKILAWGCMLVAVGFAVRSTGDWMRGFRWFSLASVPLALLFSFGCAELAEFAARIGGRRGGIGGGVVGVGLAVLAVVPQLHYQKTYDPEVTPGSVLRRVNHYRWAMRKLHLETAEIVDHDMGAMLFWGRELGTVRDAKGLIDLPFALHGAEKAFVAEYLWEEHPFDLAHAHASTGRVVRRQGRAWSEQYIEFPGYGGQKRHIGNFVRKSLFMRPWEGSTDKATEFEGGITLHGVEVFAPEVSPGSWLYLEFGVEATPRVSGSFRLLFVMRHMETGRIATYDVPLGFDDWYPVERWREGEVFVGRTTLPLAEDLPMGVYSLGVVVVGEQGVLPALEPNETPVFAAGEVHWPGRAVELVPRKRMGREAHLDVDRAMVAAGKNQCDTAERWWWKARAHRAVSGDWQASVRPAVATAIAECHARRSRIGSREEQVASIRKARRWDPVAPEVLAAGRALGRKWFAKGQRAMREGDEAAYGWFRDTLYADPSRSWARRYAEQLRSARLDRKGKPRAPVKGLLEGAER